MSNRRQENYISESTKIRIEKSAVWWLHNQKKTQLWILPKSTGFEYVNASCWPCFLEPVQGQPIQHAPALAVERQQLPFREFVATLPRGSSIVSAGICIWFLEWKIHAVSGRHVEIYGHVQVAARARRMPSTSWSGCHVFVLFGWLLLVEKTARTDREIYSGILSN